MRKNRWVWSVAVMVAGVAGWSGSAVAGPPPPKSTPAQQCEAKKNQAAGGKAECLANERAKEVQDKTPNYGKCDADLTKAFQKAEERAGPGRCATEGDSVAIERLVDACMAEVASALAGSPPASCPGVTPFLATGQTTCWNTVGTVIACAGTGQDGDVKAGAALSYTDNGDGTITDKNTGLMWEKKSDDGTIHDKDTTYTWANAFAVFIAGLNGGGGFAGYTDWRLPNYKELTSILNLENGNPAVSQAFNTACAGACTVTSFFPLCSCTAAALYWSSSSSAEIPSTAWGVDFFDGTVDAGPKGSTLRVRAVRGGL